MTRQVVAVKFNDGMKFVTIKALAEMAKRKYVLDDTIVEIDGRACLFGEIADQVLAGRDIIDVPVPAEPPKETADECVDDPFDLKEIVFAAEEPKEEREPSFALNLAIVICTGLALACVCVGFWRHG